MNTRDLDNKMRQAWYSSAHFPLIWAEVVHEKWHGPREQHIQQMESDDE